MRGHNANGCPNTVQCALCGGRGHNRATCDASKREIAAYARELQIQQDVVPIPRGPRHADLHSPDDWFHRDLLFNDQGEFDRLRQAVERAPAYQRFKDALTQIVARVHRASRFEVYVGRAGATAAHVRNRFSAHEKSQRALFISPAVRARTATIRDEDWEGRAIRLVRHWEGNERLCCNNSVGESIGLARHARGDHLRRRSGTGRAGVAAASPFLNFENS